ncbi:MAG: hypothetical protein QM662_14325 [Gordonia sp. (in: high G+C Gram-positive bacteria)]
MTPQPTLRVDAYSQLRAITEISEIDALHLYERNWRFVGELDDRERAFIAHLAHLADTYSGGRLLV